MLFSSPIFSQASGSVAGLTFAHCRAGMTVRSRSTPTNPDTARQRTVKHALARLSPYWGDLLTSVRRDAWNLYAANVTMINALGQPFYLTGQNHFLRANIPRIQSGISVLETAPTVFDLGSFTAPTIVGLTVIGNRFEVAFDNTDDWANSGDGYMLFWSGRPVNIGRDYFGGPYRYADLIPGDPIPPGSPRSLDGPWRWNDDSRFWFTARVIQPDGRLSLPIVLGPVVK